MQADIQRVLFDEPAIHRRLDQLAAQISEDYRERELTVIAVLNGSLMFMADLLRRIPLPLRLDCLSVVSYHGKAQTSGEVIFKQLALPDVTDRDILLVDDILDSGHTLAAVCEKLETAKPRSVRVCVAEQEETTRSMCRHRLCWIRNRRRICRGLRARFQRTLSQPALHWGAEKGIAGTIERMNSFLITARVFNHEGHEEEVVVWLRDLRVLRGEIMIR